MAEVSGPGLLGSDLSGGLADAIRKQADAQAKAAALRIEYDSLKEYKNLVDGLLTSLGDSQADHGKLAHGTLPAGVLGTGFPEAEDLYKSYNTVHSELQKLSKGLAGQIEALGIAILTAGKGFVDVDEETQRRMAAIAKDARENYVRKRDPYADKTPNSPSVNGGAKRGGQV
ncbi:hypothetical protein J7E99_17745 [Streptomyces sp. ISL-44]|uniref:hypothetical protein n=1 Tax=Streptomyces sp. ISL-44 TaxID=2819184 RepID=UPI001BECE598|nr:hypothetical protein [Streptomyces sp. ISL-44]MBT2542510.1 hypothetical protein [Streptomyces sp. ISL-44]